MSLNMWIALALVVAAVVGMGWNYLPSLASIKGWFSGWGKTTSATAKAGLIHFYHKHAE
jgi:hypothetical protein